MSRASRSRRWIPLVVVAALIVAAVVVVNVVMAQNKSLVEVRTEAGEALADQIKTVDGVLTGRVYWSEQERRDDAVVVLRLPFGSTPDEAAEATVGTLEKLREQLVFSEYQLRVEVDSPTELPEGSTVRLGFVTSAEPERVAELVRMWVELTAVVPAVKMLLQAEPRSETYFLDVTPAIRADGTVPTESEVLAAYEPYEDVIVSVNDTLAEED